MFKKRLSLPIKINKKIIILILSFFFIINSLISFILTKKTIENLRDKNFTQASRSANQAIVWPKILSKITFGKVAEIEAWQTSLSLVPKIDQTQQVLINLGQTIFKTENEGGEDTNLIVLQENLTDINTKLNNLKKLINSSQLLKKLFLTSKITAINQLSSDLLVVFHEVIAQPHSFLILLQNTGELRASGGFIGSYARVDLVNGKIHNLKIEDIYEPDGQFTGFVEAPPGAKKYLSGGDGLRLPDSNWHPDFPTSAQTTLSYFAFGQEHKIDSVIALNLDLIEKLLLIVGEVYLPDYDVTVTADNLALLARADRDKFFAGSKQKTNFLGTLFDNLKFKLENLTVNQQQAILELVRTALENKDLQFFSISPKLQKIFINRKIAGELKNENPNNYYFYSLESNVGINKANENVTREVSIDLGERRTDVQIRFKNKNGPNSLDYINYQRLILNPNTEIKEIMWNGQKITHYDQEIISNSRGVEFKQIGFLAPLKGGSNGLLQISLINNENCSSQKCTLYIGKQPGLPATPYVINFQEQTRTLILEKDEIIKI